MGSRHSSDSASSSLLLVLFWIASFLSPSAIATQRPFYSLWTLRNLKSLVPISTLTSFTATGRKLTPNFRRSRLFHVRLHRYPLENRIGSTHNGPCRFWHPMAVFHRMIDICSSTLRYIHLLLRLD